MYMYDIGSFLLVGHVVSAMVLWFICPSVHHKLGHFKTVFVFAEIPLGPSTSLPLPIHAEYLAFLTALSESNQDKHCHNQ